MTIADSVEGSGRHLLTRRLVTALPVEPAEEGAVTLRADDRTWRVATEGARAEIEPITRWTAYGEGVPATAITVTVRASLPWTSTLTAEIL